MRGIKLPLLKDLEKKPFPKTIRPMLASLTSKPFNNKDWIFEIKWDGYRVISFKNGNNISLISRNQTSYDEKFKSVKESLTKMNSNFVMDGEVVALDENKKPNFQLLQNYQRTGKGNLVYYVFDLLWLDGYNLKTLGVIERKALLKNILPEMKNVLYCKHNAEKGIELYNKIKKMGMEGVIAKKADSKYYEDIRSENWLKMKTVLAEEVIICGYTEPKGSREYFGALLLGMFDKKGKIKYVGHTGTGFNYKTLKQVHTLMQKQITSKSPFDKIPHSSAPVTWLKPKIVCEIKYSEKTTEQRFRHPVFMRIRDDKKPDEVVLK